MNTRKRDLKMVYDDEIEVSMVSALGFRLGTIIMPKKMEEGLKKVYFESGAVASTYLYINGVEITDGKNHNPFKLNKEVENETQI